VKEKMAAGLSGVLFSLGLGFSGMTNPHKIFGFLNIFGAWDPTLLWVMVGAVLTYGLGFAIMTRVLKKQKPIWGGTFQLPENKKITARLLLGSVLFGMGWGLGGFCPGPALVAFFSGASAPALFVLAMIAGMIGFSSWEKYFG